MGEGEATSSAVEGSMNITLRASASQDVKVSGPMVVTPEHVISFGRGVTMEEAAHAATLAMADLLMSRLNISAPDAAMLIGCAADLRTALALHSPYSMKMLMPLSTLPL